MTFPAHQVALTRFAGRAGDHNDRAMQGSAELATALTERLGTPAVVVGSPEPALDASWDVELTRARPALEAIAARLDDRLAAGYVPVTALSRCAVALATLPVVAARRPDAVVVWFDAHADLNTPDTSESGYLGGLALSGPIGLWESGLGHGLSRDQVVLVGARDVDPPEQALLDAGVVDAVPVSPDTPAVLREVVAGRPVYVHLDCDALEPGLVPTDYAVPHGLSFAQLRACAEVLADSEVVGVEIAEFEAAGPAGAARGAGPPEPAATSSRRSTPSSLPFGDDASPPHRPLSTRPRSPTPTTSHARTLTDARPVVSTRDRHRVPDRGGRARHG